MKPNKKDDGLRVFERLAKKWRRQFVQMPFTYSAEIFQCRIEQLESAIERANRRGR